MQRLFSLFGEILVYIIDKCSGVSPGGTSFPSIYISKLGLWIGILHTYWQLFSSFQDSNNKAKSHLNNSSRSDRVCFDILFHDI